MEDDSKKISHLDRHEHLEWKTPWIQKSHEKYAEDLLNKLKNDKDSIIRKIADILNDRKFIQSLESHELTIDDLNCQIDRYYSLFFWKIEKRHKSDYDYMIKKLSELEDKDIYERLSKSECYISALTYIKNYKSNDLEIGIFNLLTMSKKDKRENSLQIVFSNIIENLKKFKEPINVIDELTRINLLGKFSGNQTFLDYLLEHVDNGLIYEAFLARIKRFCEDPQCYTSSDRTFLSNLDKSIDKLNISEDRRILLEETRDRFSTIVFNNIQQDYEWYTGPRRQRPPIDREDGKYWDYTPEWRWKDDKSYWSDEHKKTLYWKF